MYNLLIIMLPLLTLGVLPFTQIVAQPDSLRQKATFAGGCFWCGDAIFRKLEGIQEVISGYTGGNVENPSYKAVVRGKTGHAEAIQITFSPKKVRYEDLLEVFFDTHDPTTLNRQGYDVGTQYRSAIFYHDDTQKEAALAYISKLTEAKAYASPIVTTLEASATFYKAEEYHQNYYARNTSAGYCRMVIAPKLRKFKKTFGDKLKKADIGL